jgi:hypothetical protein
MDIIHYGDFLSSCPNFNRFIELRVNNKFNHHGFDYHLCTRTRCDSSISLPSLNHGSDNSVDANIKDNSDTNDASIQDCTILQDDTTVISLSTSTFYLCHGSPFI